MVLNEGQERLGISGFPAEGGLFASLLEATGLYRQTSDGWRFVLPGRLDSDPCNLAPAWQAAADLLKTNAHRIVSIAEIHDIWRGPPFGIKDGLLPILCAAFILSHSHILAFYREGFFQTHISDLDMDWLAKKPKDIHLRWMELSPAMHRLLADLADIAIQMNGGGYLESGDPLDVARALVAIYDRLPSWTGRTQQLSDNARRIRHLFKQAHDPNRLLFNDIPQTLAEGADAGKGDNLRRISGAVRAGLEELQAAYPALLQCLQDLLLAELQVPDTRPLTLADLRARAGNVRRLGGDHRMEAFIVRLMRFRGTHEDMENLAGMATSKPPREWVDADIDRAEVELAMMAREFVRAEALAHVKGRRAKRHAMAVVVGTGNRGIPVHAEFDVTEGERPAVDALKARMAEILADSGDMGSHVILAALAELSVRYLNPTGHSALIEPQQKDGVAL